MTLKDARIFLDCSRQTLYRYIENGELPYKKQGKKKMFNKADLLKIASKLALNKDKHRPDTVGKEPKPKETLLSKKEEIVHLMQAAHTDDEELLNPFGKDIMIEVSEYLKETGLFTTANKLTIFRYAMACQVQAMYMKTAIETHIKDFHDLANIYTKQIQHYEKELGLTPASLAKIKPIGGEDDVVDPMEALLNG